MLSSRRNGASTLAFFSACKEQFLHSKRASYEEEIDVYIASYYM